MSKDRGQRQDHPEDGGERHVLERPGFHGPQKTGEARRRAVKLQAPPRARPRAVRYLPPTTARARPSPGVRKTRKTTTVKLWTPEPRCRRGYSSPASVRPSTGPSPACGSYDRSILDRDTPRGDAGRLSIRSDAESSGLYSYWTASTMLLRAAERAGRRPAKTPIKSPRAGPPAPGSWGSRSRSRSLLHRSPDEEVAEQRAQRDADEAADQAYDDPLVDYEAAYLEPRRPHGPEDPDLAGTLEDAHGEGVDDPEGGDGDRDAHDGVEEDVLAVEVALYLRLPLGVRVERELRVVRKTVFDLCAPGLPGRSPVSAFMARNSLLVSLKSLRERLLREVDARPAAR